MSEATVIFETNGQEVESLSIMTIDQKVILNIISTQGQASIVLGKESLIQLTKELTSKTNGKETNQA